MFKHFVFLAWCLVLPGLLSGCASFGRGVTEAILNQQTEDTRQCAIVGREFDGFENLFEVEAAQAAAIGRPAKLKILKVHGIGEHQPGYSARLLSGLVNELGFERMDETVKNVQLSSPQYPQGLGILRVHRFVNPERGREMLFYELTWDQIVEQEKQLLAFDNTAQSALLRTEFNHNLKILLNKTIPDALMYNSAFREPIKQSVGQAVCLMMSTAWDQLPDDHEAVCGRESGDYWSEFDSSSIAIVSHSLGSRISIDALQAGLVNLAQHPDAQDLVARARTKPFYLFMLSNQLPLLQLGQPLPGVYDQVPSYCRPAGDNYDQRFIANLQVVAFSDPNDLFSYAVTPQYINRFVDSRLCPSVTNVQVQIAPIRNLLGLQEIANPQIAHADYEIDSRVLKMMVSGFGNEHGQDEVRERCSFIEMIPDN